MEVPFPMLVACWSVKGGAGTTVVSASLALLLAQRAPGGAVLADLAGDLPAALGLPEPDSAGLCAWLAAGESAPADSLGLLEVAVAPGLALLPRGEGPLAPERAGLLAALLDSSPRPAVVDCGRPDGADPAGSAAVAAVVAGARRSLLVIRPCYLGLRRAMQAPLRPSGVVVVNEPGRALTTDDIRQVIPAPVLAEVPLDPAVARAVDAGMLAGRMPRSLARALSRAA
ncbi:MAG TPA: hypothetical protein VFM27_01825 [Acidimicrobiales bacterium]|nr:hypothetical protein [Acidimicrobiales bacterium]